MAGNSRECGQSVVGRLLRILEAFSPERPELTTAEISRRTGVPPSTVYRLLAELVGRGVIERVADGRYSVGLRLWEIGKLAPRAERLTEVASPYLHDLHEVTRGNVHLAVRVGGDALYLAAVCGHRCVEPVVRAGTRVPLTSTSVGQVLLAYSRSPVLEQILENDPRDRDRELGGVANQPPPRRAGRDPAPRGCRRPQWGRHSGCGASVRPTGRTRGGARAVCARRRPSVTGADGADRPPGRSPESSCPPTPPPSIDGLRRVAGLARGDSHPARPGRPGCP